MSQSIPAPIRPNKILVATDLSAYSDRALDRAVQLSGQWQVPLLAVHAMPLEAAGAWPYEHETSPRAAEDALDLIRKRIQRDLRGEVVDVDIHVREGGPAEVILEVAQRERCDLVVLGDTQDTPARNFLGNTVDSVVRRAPTSVLVVKQRPHGAYQRVQVGTDLTVESRHGLTTAAALFPLAEFTLLHALDIPYKSLWLAPEYRGDLTRWNTATNSP